MEGTGATHELLSVDEVASYLGVGPITVYRWCRQGRLPAVKVGKVWRIRRGALEDFLRRSERGQSLVSRLNAFFTVPDHVIGIAATLDLLHRLDAAFFQVGEARGGTLVKCYAGETTSVDELRAALTRYASSCSRRPCWSRWRTRGPRRSSGGRRPCTRARSGSRTPAWRSAVWLPCPRHNTRPECVGQEIGSGHVAATTPPVPSGSGAVASRPFVVLLSARARRHPLLWIRAQCESQTSHNGCLSRVRRWRDAGQEALSAALSVPPSQLAWPGW
jgi:excisionase family DNA binding protein